MGDTRPLNQEKIALTYAIGEVRNYQGNLTEKEKKLIELFQCSAIRKSTELYDERTATAREKTRNLKKHNKQKRQVA